MKPTSNDILPQPFAWIKIPEGRVTLITDESRPDNYIPKGESGKAFIVPMFEIAKYPVTNAQFNLFIEAGGYDEKSWWTESGWIYRQKYNWTLPRSWDDPDFLGDDKPVAGVSWYESVAFCLWLSHTTGEAIMLPFEGQWQRAAQGDNGFIYPWGNDWNADLCNHDVDGVGINKTTPVHQYEGKGDSPFGVVDMAGNVNEWCFTSYFTGHHDINATDERVERGGAWLSWRQEFLRANFRMFVDPATRFNAMGFRLARF
jgi:formylglycine-generating enzyme required for sulfatase activity